MPPEEQPPTNPPPPTAAADEEATPPVAVQAVPKTVYLIRHAESMENQRIASMFSCLGDLGRFSLPKTSDVGASLELLNISANADAPISEMGHQQCAVMKEILQKHDFLVSQQVELIVHSPLQRAKDTCVELLGYKCDQLYDEEQKGKDNKDIETIHFVPGSEEKNKKKDMEDSSGTTTETEAPRQNFKGKLKRVINLQLLTEKSHKEWLPGSSGSFERRVSDFQRWLTNQPETTVCIVGHSQFFKLLLGLPFKFQNCDVYKVTFDPQKTKPNEPVILEHDGTADECRLNPQWYDLEKLFSCNTQSSSYNNDNNTPASKKEETDKEKEATSTPATTDQDTSESSL